ncbi:MAG TPA: AAA family ATPase, partial [Thermoguttaceae bacterium]|nr:AAA family ATPase [Thermoguttaceae bacterium]
MRILIASDDEPMARNIAAILTRHGAGGEACRTVPLDSAANHAGRLPPELLLLVLRPDPAAALAALREIRHTVRATCCLMVGPADDPRLILESLHEGADEYLDDARLETELAAALVRRKAKQTPHGESQDAGRVIAVLAPSGGSGSSTVAANVATVLAQHHGQSALIDLRLAAGDLASMLDLKPARTICDLCDHLARVDQSMFEQFFTRHASGVHLLAAPGEPADVKRVTAKGVRRTLTMARVRFPYVVVDLDNALGDVQVEALLQSDVVLLVLRLDYTSLRNARRITDHLTSAGIGPDRIRAVVNGYRQPRQLGVGQAEEALGMKLPHCIPHDPARMNGAINKGIPVV